MSEATPPAAATTRDEPRPSPPEPVAPVRPEPVVSVRPEQAVPEQAVRPALTRERIVRAAIGLIEADGPEALSMRRVATALDVAVMSLYNHVPNKKALLEGVAEHVANRLDLADDPSAPWPERARALVRAHRKMARDFPRSLTVVLSHKVDTPAGLRPAERALAVAAAAGFDGPTSVRAMRALLAYAVGTQMRELRVAEAFAHLGTPAADSFARLDPDEFPHVIALASELAENDTEADFEFGLDLLITALQLRAARA
ncbi:TetR family transcriptional regulator [Actinomadura logoneensis]|uniref:TetR family transcriptional regulator n=1 Tax=Actinomadura logoneensis TaxID=2293572 RepID=A0A372JKM6_9ACTN|nr:TetR/AcrR family transcriptional regulator C-terminal domain-containing protein [Actinomadura logoneensis]RFU40577.1 TetR family transcriptional regulator [Actinomadura logoneensis]